MELSMAGMLSSVSVVIALRDARLDVAQAEALIAALARDFLDVETVIVAHGLDAAGSVALREAAERLPDATVVFLREETHDDLALLLGIDHAISDYVLFATPLPSEVAALPPMIQQVRAGCELVIGEGEGGVVVDRGAAERALYALFRGLFRLTAGVTFEARPARFRILSRAAALYVATSPDGEVLIRARQLGHGFASAVTPVGAAPVRKTRGAPARKGAGKALRLLLTGSALPLRLSSYLGFLTGVASVIYAGYVVAIYLFKADVAPGWTTLSLQSAGMMFLFSLQFLFLSEYLVQILSASPSGSRRHLVAREIRTPLTRRSGRLNLVDEEGRFQLGAPAALLDTDEA